MQQERSAVAAVCLLALGLVGMQPAAAQAQASAEPWKFEATIYGWFPAIGGNTSFPPAGGGPSIDVSTRQVIDALKFAFMGTFEAKTGKWGLWTDLVYADFGASKSGFREFDLAHAPLPVDLSADLNLDIKSWIWTMAGTYNLASTPEYSTDLVAGARLLDMSNTLGYTFSASTSGNPLAGRSGTAEVSANFWDAIVGLKGKVNFGAERTWFIPYYVDVGAGQSKLTWSVNAGVGYQFGWGSVIATWRYMDYQFKSSSRVESMSFNGPTIGASFQF